MNKNSFSVAACTILFFMTCILLFGQEKPGDITAPATFGDMVERTVYHGETQAKESVSIHVPEMQGEYMLTIKEVLDDGEKVKEGDVVIRFDDSSYQKELESALDELELAKADLEKTRFEMKNRLIDLDLEIQKRELEMEKAKVMVVENSVIISRIDLEKSKLAVKSAGLELAQARKGRLEFEKENRVNLEVKELAVKEAERKVKKQKDKIEKAVVKAPREGLIFKPFVRLNNEMGRVEKNKVVSPGDKLLEVPNLSDFQGVIYINPSDNRFIKASDAASIFLYAMPEKEFKGFVLKKDSFPLTRNERLGRNDPEGTLEENRVTLEITDHDPIFRPGMSFRAEIASVLATGCLYIPRIAVFEDDKKENYVLVRSSQDSFEKRMVKTGRTGITWIEVLSGLKNGDQVRLSETQ